MNALLAELEPRASRRIVYVAVGLAIAAGFGWRPRDSFELALVGAYGNALGRSNDESSLTARLGLTWRW